MKKFFLLFISCFSINTQAACDVKSLIGNYAQQITYTTYNTRASYNNGTPTMCVDIGIRNFDGKGTTSFSCSLSCINADIRTYKSTGSYKFDATCSGEINFSSGEIVKFVLDKTLKNGIISSDAVLSIGTGTMFKQ